MEHYPYCNPELKEKVSPRTCGEHLRAARVQEIAEFLEFQLTHPSRGATPHITVTMQCSKISTHAPLARCDSACYRVSLARSISTHAPLARCDAAKIFKILLNQNFNSRTPREVRQKSSDLSSYLAKFQLTHPSRGATRLNKLRAV